MLDLLVGPLALAARYVLILAAGWLANAGLAGFDGATITIQVDDAAKVIAAGVAFGAALVWRKVAARMGGAT